jgi:hypothetical protein
MSRVVGLKEMAREGIRSGKLPNRRPSVTWGGFANGARCAVCDTGFTEDDLEIEFEDPASAKGGMIHMHVACHVTWEAELTTAREPDSDIINGSQTRQGESR